MLRRAGQFWALLVAASVCANGVGAQDDQGKGPALNWTRRSGAETCISPIELARRVEARVGRSIFVTPARAIVVVEGYVEPAHGGFSVELAVSDAAGTVYGVRELHAGSDCRALDDALVLVIAVTLRPQDGFMAGIALPAPVAAQLDALFGDEPSEAEPPPVQAAPNGAALPSAPQKQQSVVAPVVPVVPVVTASAPQAVAPRLSAELGASAQSGLQPGLSSSPELGVLWLLGELGSLRLQAAVSAPTTRRVLDDAVRSDSSFQVVSAAAGYCPVEARPGPGSVMLCAGARLGWISAHASGFRVDNPGGTRSFVTLQAKLRGALALNRWLSGFAAVGPELQVSRPAFSYQSASGASVPLYSPALWELAVELGLSVRIL